ncbi:ABC transporter substrate-binding protein [Haloarcula amylovorans]|uniref:ABC transporter substrate-binding protein n=1 Tax=Haloarcula amylovorans TaxID=2562280 RepID=UPI001076AE88|nr:ABC transporter substrate-binding protein [Halomicroarcula amylolytica]
MSEKDFTQSTVTRRNVLEGIGSVVGTASLAGCGTPLGASGGTQLRYLQVLSPKTLDPITFDDPWSAQPAGLVFQGLYTYDQEMNLVPVLADGTPEVSEDGTTYTVSLADESQFQNGNAVTSEDVKYSFDPKTYEESESPNHWQVDMIEEIRTPDDRTVEFQLAYSYPAFEHTLTRAVVPESVRGQNAETFGEESPTGSGPYEVEIFKPGSYVVLSKWDDYWGDPMPSISKVKMVTNHAGLSRSMSLLTNQSDIVERVHPKLWKTTKRYMGANVASEQSYHSHFVGFNCSPGSPTRMKEVREAVDYLFSTDDLVSNIIEPAGKRQYSPIPDHLAEEWGLPLQEWRDLPREKNQQKARELVKEAGVKQWAPLVATPHDKMREKFAQTIVKGLRAIGFGKARVKKYHWSEFREKVTSGDASDYDMYIGSWAGYADPDTFLYPLFHDSMEGLTNGMFYQNPAVRKQLEDARTISSRDERRNLYADAITSILEDKAALPLYTLDNSFGVKNHVQGFNAHPLSQLNPQLLNPSGGVSLRK